MKKFLWLVVGAAAAAIAGILCAQPYSSGPITEFHRPVFNARDIKIWDIRGSEATFRSKDELELTKLHVTMYTGDASEAIDVELYTPLARVDLAQRAISGPGILHVVGRGAELLGSDWSYAEEPPVPPADRPTKVFVIRRDAVVTFVGDLGNVLK